MHPILATIGPLEIRSYSVFSALAMFAAMFVVVSEARRRQWPQRDAAWLVVYCTLFGFLGAHLLYVLTRLELSIDQLWALFWKLGIGNVWYGGFFAGLLCCLLFAKRHNIARWAMLDVAALAVLIAQPVGRLGCWLGGCCYGKPTDLPWGMHIQNPDYGVAVALHPVALYEAAFLTSAFLLMWSRRTAWSRTPGKIAGWYLIIQPLGRFGFEFLRGDRVRGFVWNWVTTSQAIAFFLLMAAGIILAVRKHSWSR